MFLQVCVCSRGGGGGGIPACITGGIPACLACFQAHTQGEVEGDLVSRPTSKGEVEGGQAGEGESPGPHPRGKLRGIRTGGSPGPHPGGLPAPWGGGVWRPPPWRLLLRAVHILLECILVQNVFESQIRWQLLYSSTGWQPHVLTKYLQSSSYDLLTNM